MTDCHQLPMLKDNSKRLLLLKNTSKWLLLLNHNWNRLLVLKLCRQVFLGVLANKMGWFWLLQARSNQKS